MEKSFRFCVLIFSFKKKNLFLPKKRKINKLDDRRNQGKEEKFFYGKKEICFVLNFVPLVPQIQGFIVTSLIVISRLAYAIFSIVINEELIGNRIDCYFYPIQFWLEFFTCKVSAS